MRVACSSLPSLYASAKHSSLQSYYFRLLAFHPRDFRVICFARVFSVPLLQAQVAAAKETAADTSSDLSHCQVALKAANVENEKLKRFVLAVCLQSCAVELCVVTCASVSFLC